MNRFFTLLLAATCLTAVGQSEYCLEGTVWDPQFGGCIPVPSCAISSDLSGDGVVGAGDLLLFLGDFGSTIVDSDFDGICDDIDGCVGGVDDCGVCNGPGPIYSCGCTDVPIGDCDCSGNQLDALGICGGDCISDINGDGVCDVNVDDPCGGTNVMTYQGKDYDLVEIGGRCWFATDLAVTTYQDGTPIPEGDSENWYEFGLNFTGAYFDVSNVAPGQGFSYNWYALQAYGGLCPVGWHVPSIDEFDEMKQAVFEMDNALPGWLGVQFSLKSSDVFDGDNASGFSASPTVRIVPNTQATSQQLTISRTWTISPSSSANSWAFDINSGQNPQDQEGEFKDSEERDWGYDVRCIKDSE